MGSATSKTDDENVITLEELAAYIALRREELSLPDLPRNSGKRRTESKKALLKTIKELGGEW
ncbi:hypothetical protein [Alterisphingorhabdus coralli]|uniref:Uncharacterized protein n=1 Tax=Alterisphingorhabdus coralli TaxID=3071408 RepID=A0AA97F7K0_9SPHN|nr:hypothetical protein [Parasphingorhabdus sp. SCSIO 66989]WOE74931.1 hypothetical protein RB602_13990 [Parasphingorhabdus sp. SCSIO 66989]